jgi:hypothetical protein
MIKAQAASKTLFFSHKQDYTKCPIHTSVYTLVADLSTYLR